MILSEKAIGEVICDYHRAFGVTLRPEDVTRMMFIADMFEEVFEKYENDLDCSTDLPEFAYPILGL